MIRTQSRKITSLIKTAFMLSITISLISAGIFVGSDALFVSAKKPAAVIEWSNGFPSGEHANLNIHGKKLDPFFNCDNSEAAEPFGGSIFVKMRETAEYPGPSKIEFVSNKRASINILKVLDPCAAPFGQEHHHTDSALIQLEAKEMQVYWRILGKPNNGNNSPSEAMLTFPRLIDACNFLPVAFEDGSIVNSFDPDAVANAGVGLGLIAFNVDEKWVDNNLNGVFDADDSIYRDNGDGVVGPGDTLLYAGTGAAPGDMLLTFLVNVKHEDTGLTMGSFDPGETVYLSADAFVSAGDTRLANASSQGLPESEGGDAINCEDDTLVGLGLINNKGVFLKEGETLKRFEDPEPVKGKGKSKAVNITDLFIWSGVLCDPASAADVDGNGEISLADDYPLLMEANIMAAAIAAGVYTEDGLIDNAEFIAYLAATYADCFAFYETWIFIIADIVRYGIDYVNDGATLTQIRFYPVETLFD